MLSYQSCRFVFFLMIRRPPRCTQSRSSSASDVYKRQYEEVVDQINQIRRFGNLAGVEVAGRMLKALGSPQAGIPLIHIAGTNGKGSVSAFLCAILREAGLRVGMFTSPHLVDFRERIQINGEMISKEDTQRIGVQLLEMDFGVQPTMFDVTLAMAILYFKEQRCDVMILSLIHI